MTDAIRTCGGVGVAREEEEVVMVEEEEAVVVEPK
jgi:hypothetical protein